MYRGVGKMLLLCYRRRENDSGGAPRPSATIMVTCDLSFPLQLEAGEAVPAADLPSSRRHSRGGCRRSGSGEGDVEVMRGSGVLQ